MPSQVLIAYSPSAMPKIRCAVRVTTTNRAVRSIPKTWMYGVKSMASSRNTASAMAQSQLRRRPASPIRAIYMMPNVTPLLR